MDALLVPLANIGFFGGMVRLPSGRLSPSPRPNAGLTEPLLSWRGSFFSAGLRPSERANFRRNCPAIETGSAANIDGSRAAFSPSGQDAGESCSLSAMRAKSGKEEAFIFRMTWPRCTLAVTSLIPRS
jgi:hypothetical protein